MRYVEEKIRELYEATWWLPSVDAQGRSECPFAEQVHCQKEEKLAEVEPIVANHRTWVESLTEYAESRLEALGDTEVPNELMRYAMEPMDPQWWRYTDDWRLIFYLEAVCARERAQKVFAKADAQLKESRSKKWPLAKPRPSRPSQ